MKWKCSQKFEKSLKKKIIRNPTLGVVLKRSFVCLSKSWPTVVTRRHRHSKDTSSVRGIFGHNSYWFDLPPFVLLLLFSENLFLFPSWLIFYLSKFFPFFIPLTPFFPIFFIYNFTFIFFSPSPSFLSFFPFPFCSSHFPFSFFSFPPFFLFILFLFQLISSYFSPEMLKL